MFLHGQDYTQKVRELVSMPNSVDIAVAFLGADAEGLLATTSGGRVICNLESGATNPSAVKALRKNPSFEVRTLSSLHAKVIISGGSFLCGSANISANGLGLESSEIARWYEAGIFSEITSEVEAARKWFSELWQIAAKITDEDLGEAALRWKARRSSRPLGTQLKSAPGLFSHLMANPEFALDRPIYAAVYRDYASPEADSAYTSWKEEHGANVGGELDFYEDWPELPDNAYLVDIHFGPRGKLTPTGLYWTSPESITKQFQKKDGHEGQIRMVFKKKAYGSLVVRSKELNAFIDLITPAIKARYTAANCQAYCIPLADVLADVVKAKVPYKPIKAT